MTVSLGVIETVGFTAAIHAADAACKAAGVSLTGYRKAGSGLVSVYFEGEISAVKAAVECGIDAISDSAELCMSLVMARPDTSVLAMLTQGSLTDVTHLGEPAKEPNAEIEASDHPANIVTSGVTTSGPALIAAVTPVSAAEDEAKQGEPATVEKADKEILAEKSDAILVANVPNHKSATARSKRGSTTKSQGSKK